MMYEFTYDNTPGRGKTVIPAFTGTDMHVVLAHMDAAIRELNSEIEHTSKWRKVKRYRLLEKLFKLEGDRGLIEHVMQ